MVLINYATKEIVAKIVYYGPGLCGKTTNLQQVFARLNPKKRGKMISLATEADRTLFFDFLPMELGMVQGFKVRFQLYTVPGQVFYGATRRLVLKGADAVVFVADSQKDVLGKNAESIADMKENLIENSLDPEVVPIVFQYNKRDLDNVLTVEELDRELNYRGAPFVEASAIEGAGVMETFKEITRLLLQSLKAKHAFMNTDKLKELPAEMFEYKKEPPPGAAEEKPVEYELELGSGIREEGTEEDVVAGELLDQMETISLADSVQAEAFFDGVRKGASTEEARQKAETVTVQPGRSGVSGGLVGMEDFMSGSLEVPAPAGESEVSFEGLLDEKPLAEAVKETEPVRTAEPVRKPEPAPAPPPAPAVEEYIGLDMTSPEMMEPDVEYLSQQDTVPVSAAPVKAPPPSPQTPSAPPVDISPIVLALERLEMQVAALGGEVSELRSAVSAPPPAPVKPDMAAPSMPPDIANRLEELSAALKAAMEGQDKLLLAIIESVRESKRSSANGFEKMEDGFKYIIDKIRDMEKDEGKGAKKKWF